MTGPGPEFVFDVVRRGYDRDQVEDVLNGLSADLAVISGERDRKSEKLAQLVRQLEMSRTDAQSAAEAAARARNERDSLRAQVAELSTVPHTVDGMSERLQQMIRIAQDEVHDMRSRATANASHVLSLAQAEANELRERSALERQEFESERAKSEEALRSQLEESRERLDQLRQDSDGQKARYESELAERRSVAEKALAEEMDQMREAVVRELADQRAAQATEAVRIIDAAGQEARNVVAEAAEQARRLGSDAHAEVAAAKQELDELRGLSHQVSEQLTSVRALLDWTLPKVVPNGTPRGGVRSGSDGRAGHRSGGGRPAELTRPAPIVSPWPRPAASSPNVPEVRSRRNETGPLAIGVLPEG